MNTLNSLLGWIMSLIFAPISGWPAQVSLIVWSALTGVLLAWVFRYTSNQAALRSAADQIRAQLLSIKLFKDDLGVMFRAQSKLFQAIGRRLLHSMLPLCVLIVPVVLLLIQLARWYEYEPLALGESSVVQLQLSPAAWESHKLAVLEVPDHIELETAPLRDEEQTTVYWRIRPTSAASATLRWQFGSEVIEKQLTVADNQRPLQSVSIRRPGTDWLDRLWNPGESGFAANSPVTGIEVQHRQRSIPLFGVEIPWWLTFFVVSMVAALLAKPWLKVQF